MTEGNVRVTQAKPKGKALRYTLYAVLLVVGVFVVWHTKFDVDIEGAKTSLNTGATYVGEAATTVGNSASELYDNIIGDDPTVEAPVTTEGTTE